MLKGMSFVGAYYGNLIFLYLPGIFYRNIIIWYGQHATS